MLLKDLSKAFTPEEGELLSVHPGAQSETGIFSKRRDNHGEDQCYQDKTGRKDDLESDSHKHNNNSLENVLQNKRTLLQIHPNKFGSKNVLSKHTVSVKTVKFIQIGLSRNSHQSI